MDIRIAASEFAGPFSAPTRDIQDTLKRLLFDELWQKEELRFCVSEQEIIEQMQQMVKHDLLKQQVHIGKASWFLLHRYLRSSINKQVKLDSLTNSEVPSVSTHDRRHCLYIP